MSDANMDALFESRGGLQASDGQLSRLRQLMAEESDTRAEIETAEAMLESSKERNRELRNKLIPAAMLDAQLREFTTDDGTKAKITFITDGALGSAKTPEEQAIKEAKLDLIIASGGGEIVKQTVTIEFPKEMVEQAETFREWCQKEMEKRKWNVLVSRERSVNHQTLGSWIRERMASGDAEDHLPPSFFERIGIWYGEAAKITRPKPKVDK